MAKKTKKKQAPARKKKAVKKKASSRALPAATKPTDQETRERLIELAIRHFAQHGFEGTSAKEICREAEANMASIHYYFGSKANLYREVLNRFSREHFDFANRILIPAQTAEEFQTRLTIFLTEMFESVARQPDLAKAVMRDAQDMHEDLTEIFDETFGCAHDALVSFFQDAQNKGLIRKKISIELAHYQFNSLITSFIASHKIVKRKHKVDLMDPETRKNWINQMVDLLLNGLLTRK